MGKHAHGVGYGGSIYPLPSFPPQPLLTYFLPASRSRASRRHRARAVTTAPCHRPPGCAARPGTRARGPGCSRCSTATLAQPEALSQPLKRAEMARCPKSLEFPQRRPVWRAVAPPRRPTPASCRGGRAAGLWRNEAAPVSQLACHQARDYVRSPLHCRRRPGWGIRIIIGARALTAPMRRL